MTIGVALGKLGQVSEKVVPQSCASLNRSAGPWLTVFRTTGVCTTAHQRKIQAAGLLLLSVAPIGLVGCRSDPKHHSPLTPCDEAAPGLVLAVSGSCSRRHGKFVGCSRLAWNRQRRRR